MGWRDRRATIAGALSAVLLLGGCVTGPASPRPETEAADKIVYVTRHMHKADGPDPVLSPEGVAAAERLAALLADKGITAIYTTATRRAMETAAPLARRIGVRVTAYDPADPGGLVAVAAATPGAVLVVGHSNTVHDLVTRFGARTPPAPLTDDDYGRVFVVKPTGDLTVLDI